MLVIIDMCIKSASRAYCFDHLYATIKNFNVPFQVVKRIDELPPSADIDAIILSGSPIRLTSTSFNKKEAAAIGLAIYAHVANLDKPILGICFGFQLLNLLYGGEIEPFGRLVCERIKGLEYCFNDYIRKQGHGFRVQKRAIIDGRRVIVHVTKGNNIVGYLFHSEVTDQDKHGYIKRFLKKI